MGLTKKVLPKSAKQAIAKNLDRLPEGFIKDNFANAVTLEGVALVGIGVAIGGKAGMALRGFGGLHDDWDGDASRYLKKANKRGKFLDAGADKVKVLLEMFKLFKSAAQLPEGERLTRRMALGFIATKHAVNGTLNSVATARGFKAETSPAGQANMWVDGIAMGSFGISDEINNPRARKIVAGVGYAATAVGVPLGLYTIAGYVDSTIINPQPCEEIELQRQSPEEAPAVA